MTNYHAMPRGQKRAMRKQSRAVVGQWASNVLGMSPEMGLAFLADSLMPGSDHRQALITDITPDQLAHAFQRGQPLSSFVTDILIEWWSVKPIRELTRPDTLCVLVAVSPLLKAAIPFGGTPVDEIKLTATTRRAGRMYPEVEEALQGQGFGTYTLVEVTGLAALEGMSNSVGLVKEVLEARELIAHFGDASPVLTEVLPPYLHPLIEKEVS